MKKKSNLLYHEKKAKKQRKACIAGIDEAGRGPLAGPVVSASLVLRCEKFKSRIDDSKKLTPRQRLVAYKEILRKAWVGVGIVDEKTIDRINIYQATALSMKKAVQSLAVKPDILLVDGNVRIKLGTDQVRIPKGDSKSLSIACASIVAKVTRDRMMEEYHKKYPEYNFARHKGYGTREHMARLKEHGPSPIHRRSFRPLRQH